VGALKTSTLSQQVMDVPSKWSDHVSELSAPQQELLFGTSLSRRFSRLPLWLSHPGNIGAFYGLLISLALILPYFLNFDSFNQSLTNWILISAVLMSACLFLGFTSLILISFTKRMPIAPPRIILYPMPFIGLGLFGLEIADVLDVSPTLTYFFLLLPGPAYVHLSWAPRWRLLCMLDDGVNPFEGVKTLEEVVDNSAAEMAGEDTELLEVVDAFESE
jgi:hypothetical protein